MPTSSATHAPLAGGRSSNDNGLAGEPMSATPASASSSSSSISSSFRFVPAFSLGVVAAVAFQLAWGGLSLIAFFLKLFIYVSFALLCFLAGSFVLLVRKSPAKVISFRSRGQSAALLDFFNKLMARFSVPVQESVQNRRVVISHNVDKALKEGILIPYNIQDTQQRGRSKEGFCTCAGLCLLPLPVCIA